MGTDACGKGWIARLATPKARTVAVCFGLLAWAPTARVSGQDPQVVIIEGMIGAPSPVLYQGGQPLAPQPYAPLPPTATRRWVNYSLDDGNTVVMHQLSNTSFEYCTPDECDVMGANAFRTERKTIFDAASKDVSPSCTQCIMSAEAYEALPCLPTAVTSSPSANEDMNTVVVRKEALSGNLACDGMALYQSPMSIDVYNSGDPPENVRSLLVDPHTWKILDSSTGVIARQFAYIIPTEDTRDYCKFNEAGVKIGDVEGLGNWASQQGLLIEGALSEHFKRCGPNDLVGKKPDGATKVCLPGVTCSEATGPWILGPVPNVDLQMAWGFSNFPIHANESSVFHYAQLAGPGTGYSLWAIIPFRRFNPRLPKSATFYFRGPSGVTPGRLYSESLLLSSSGLVGSQVATAIDSIYRSATISGRMIANFPLDARFVQSRFWLQNTDANRLPIGPGVHTVAGGAAFEDRWPAGVTSYSTDDVGGHLGLVREISAADLRDTTLYVFRKADGRLIGERWALSDRDLACDETTLGSDPGTGEVQEACERGGVSKTNTPGGVVHALVRATSRHAFGGGYGQPALELEIKYAPVGDYAGVNPPPETLEGGEHDGTAYLPTAVAQGLRAGDALQLILVNHATGYIATANLDGTGNPFVLSPDRPLELRPPNLRIWAEREYDVAGGPDGESRNYTVGSEGAALDSDTKIRIYTEWLDHDGSPLPEDLPGYTGRLISAVSSSGGLVDATAIAAIGPVPDGRFEIKPGRRMQVLKLEGTGDTAQFYIHVDGTSMAADSGLSTHVAGPVLDFSATQICYDILPPPRFMIERCDGRDNDLDGTIDEQNYDGEAPCPKTVTRTCSFTRSASDFFEPDAGPSEASPHPKILLQRPWTYVPVQVPVFNKAKTDAARQDAFVRGLPKPPPVYDYKYRPEYHFTLLDLGSFSASHTSADGTIEQLIDVDGSSVHDYGNYLGADDQSLQFDLLLKEDPNELERFSEDRELRLDFDDGAGSTSGPLLVYDKAAGQWDLQGNIDGATLAQVDALYLLQAGDEGNILFEYALPKQPAVRVWAVDPERTDVAPGDSIGLLAEVVGLEGSASSEVTCKIEKGPVGLELEQQGSHTNGGTTKARFELSASEDAKEGKVVLRCEYTGHPHIFTRAPLNCGCGCSNKLRGGGLLCKRQGAANIRLPGPGEIAADSGNDEGGGVDISINLGPGADGGSAGEITLEAPTIDPTTCEVGKLGFGALSEEGLEAIYVNNELSQLHSDTGLAMIEPAPDGNGFTVALYAADPEHPFTLSEQGQYGQPPYDPRSTFSLSYHDTDAEPYVGSDKLRIVEYQAERGETTTHYYAHSDQDGWKLAHDVANGEYTEEQSLAPDAQGAVGAVTRTFAIGRKAAPEPLVEHVEERYETVGERSVLVERHSWFGLSADREEGTDGYLKTLVENRIDTVVYDDGREVHYDYDDKNRVSRVATTQTGLPHVVTYDYTPLPGDACENDKSNLCRKSFKRPRATEVSVGGVITSKTLLLIEGGEAGAHTETELRCATADSCSFADPTSGLRETRAYYPTTSDPDVWGSKPDWAMNDKLATASYPDGRTDTYTYESGTWSGSVFLPGPDKDTRTTVLHTGAGVGRQPGMRRREVSIVDRAGNVVREESHASSDNGVTWFTLNWSTRQYNADGKLVRADYNDGTYETHDWSCCAASKSRDRQGITTTTLLNATGQVVTELVETEPGDGVTTTYSYDAFGRVIGTLRKGGGEQVSTATSYDTLGRIASSTDEQGRTTTYAYTRGVDAGLDHDETLVTRTGSGTERTLAYIDGGTQAVVGSGVVGQHYSYNATAEGLQTTVCTGSSNPDIPGASCETTLTDMLGRTTRVTRFGGQLTVDYEYEPATGLLLCERPSSGPATCYEYDDMGQQIGSFMDLDGDASPDANERRSQTLTSLRASDANLGAGQWMVQVQRVGQGNTLIATGSSGQRLDLPGWLLAEQATTDIHGNVSRTTTVGQGYQTTRTTVGPADSSETRSRAGRVTETYLHGEGSPRVSYGYDGLHRRTTVTSARTGASSTTYDPATGRVTAVTDAAGHATTFTYDGAGRKASETNAAGKTTYYAYNLRGQVTNVWGHVPYPVRYAYDDAGRRTGMWTYRDSGLDFSTDTWPAGADAAGDKTTWNYDATTGLLTSKTDAAGKSVSYTYYPDGKLWTRTWARGGTTTYSYYPTGELHVVDYSDPSTPDVTYTYDELGRVATVTDAVGTRTMVYDPQTLQLTDEQINGQGAFNGVYDVTLHRKYEADGVGEVPGRAAGVRINDGSDYDVTYGYEAGTGRFQRAAWNVDGQADEAAYAYLPSSDLLAGMATASGQDAAYGYEPHRNLKTQVKNTFDRGNGPEVVSQFDYTYDNLGRRTHVENSGSEFAQAAFTSWGYDDRNQVTDSDRFLGTLANVGAAVTDETRDYSYDAIGNRKTATQWDEDTSSLANLTYTPNNLNQYDNIDGTLLSHDDDGNMTADDDGMALTYNGENRLVHAEKGQAWAADYAYDYLGRRVRKEADTDGDGVWDYRTYFVYDGWNVIKEVREDNGGATSTKRYVWGLDLSGSMQGAGGIGGLLAVVDGDQQVFTFDGNGNVSEVLAAADGAEQAHYEYDAFGNVVVSSGPGAEGNQWRFSTKPVDEESGLSVYPFREYHALLGRWVTRDPGEEIDGPNLLAFVHNSPVGEFDLLGLLTWNDLPIMWTVGNTIPGLPIGTNQTFTMKPTHLAITVPRFKIEGFCERCSGGWHMARDGVEGLIINFWSQVYLRASFSSPAQESWVKRAELDHAADMASWAKTDGRRLARRGEKALLQVLWPNEKACKAAIAKSVSLLLVPSLRAAYTATIERNDKTKRHTWNHSGARQ